MLAALVSFVLVVGVMVAGSASVAQAAPGDLAHGKVVVDSNKDGTIAAGPVGNNDLPGLAGVKVTLRGSNPDNPVATTTTAADGTWSFTQADATKAAPGPYTVTIDAAGVNGNAYLTPLTPTPGVNDFTRVAGDGNTQKSVSASVPANANNITLNATVYPTWSTSIIPAADPTGYQGNAVYTGTGPFDANDSQPGFDSGQANNRVRSGDVVNYNWSYTVNAEQDLKSNVDAYFEQTITLAKGAIATFGQYPAACNNKGRIVALPSGTVLQPRVDPPAGTTSVVLTCSLGQMGEIKGAAVVDAQIFVSANSPNGATFTTSVRSYGATPEGVTTARPDGPKNLGPIEITAAPRYDLEKVGPRVYSLTTATINGVTMQGYKTEWAVQITTDRRTGVEAFVQPVTFTESLWGAYNQPGQNGANGTINPNFKWYVTDCKPFSDSNFPFPGVAYGKAGVNSGAVAARSASDSGNCSYVRTGAADTGNYAMTVSGIDASGAHYPTLDKSGNTLPANKFIVSSLEVSAFIPVETIDAMTGAANDQNGSAQFWNRVSGFDPVGVSGAKNYNGAKEPGYCETKPNTDGVAHCANMPDGTRSNNVAGPATITISRGEFGKSFTNAIADWALDTRGLPQQTTGGTGFAEPGEVYTSRVQATLPFGATGFQACDIWDNTMLKPRQLRDDIVDNPTSYGPAAGVYSGVVSSPVGTAAADRVKLVKGYQANFITKWAHIDLTGDTANNGTFSTTDNRFGGDWTKQQAAANGAGNVCAGAAVTWYDSPDAVPGGVDQANAAWLQFKEGYTLPPGQGLDWLLAFEQRDTYNGGPHAGQTIPENTIAANFATMKPSATADWLGNNYVPGSGTTAGTTQPNSSGLIGDRWTLTRARIAVTKNTIAGTVNGVAATGASAIGQTGSAQAGTPVIWQINPSVTSGSATPPDVKNLVITDTLPVGATYDAAGTSALADNVSPASATVNADGTTTLVWTFPSWTPNQKLGPFKVATLVDSLLPNNTSLVNKVNIKADGIVVNAQFHNDDHTVVVSQPGSLQLKKSVDHVLDLQDKDQVYTLQVRNFSETLRVQSPTIIDVLPYNGDATNAALVNRNPASKHTGSNKLDAAPTVFQFNGTTPATGTFYYTTVAPASVPQDLNADTDPSIWSTTFTPNATAFKFVADKPLGTINDGPASGLVIKFKTDQSGNAAGDLYANRFTAFSKTFFNQEKYQILTSNQVLVRVIGFSLGDLVWFDKDNDGKFTPGVDQAAPEGVQVEVHKADGSLAPGGKVTTNKDGRWVVNDLPEGDYYAVIPASQFAPGGPLEGYVVQTVNSVADPNNNANESADHNAVAADGGIKTGNIHLAATVKGDTITGNGPLNDNTGNLPVTPGTTDDFTNFTLDMALKPAPGYTFTKTADPKSGTDVKAGSTITYTLTGTNTGKTSLDVAISDDLSKVKEFAAITTAPAAAINGKAASAPAVDGSNLLTWNGTLQPGQKVTITYTATIGEGHEGKVVNNKANSTATPPNEPPITPPEVVTEHPIPGYTFAKASDPASGTDVQAGKAITYTLTGVNTGATVLDPVTVNDDMTQVVAFADVTTAPKAVIVKGGSETAAAAPVVTDGKLVWTGKLGIGESVKITYTVTVKAGFEGKTLHNKADSTAKPPTTPPITPPPGETEHPIPGYTFAKKADPVSGTAVQAGKAITYTLTGVNTGATVLDPVTVNDDMTQVVAFADVTTAPKAVIVKGGSETAAAAPVVTDGKLVWTGKLGIGESVKITYTVTVKAGFEGKTLHNKADSTAKPPTTPPITPPPGETEHPIPGYTFAKKSNPVSGTAVSPKGYIVYTLTGVNTGATALDVTIKDDLSKVLNHAKITEAPVATISGGAGGTAPAVVVSGDQVSWKGTLEVGQKVEITYTVQLNEDTDTGAVVVNNQASSKAQPPGDTPPITPPEVVTEHPVPGYTFTKVSDPVSGTPMVPGGEITYTLTGTNTGATVLDPVVIKDDLSKVLNHATVVKEPVVTIKGAKDVPSAQREGDQITWTGKLDKGQSVTITYTVKLNADAEGVLVNNHASSSATPPGLPPITPPDVETWHPTPGYTFNKVADPASGSTVQAGDSITYTLTGTNSGKTELHSVVSDDLSKVLDKADLGKAPVASIVKDGKAKPASSQPVLAGTKLTWDGKLEIGEQVVIVYSVKVKVGGEGKIVNNVASSTATPPVGPPITPPEVVTEHPIPGYTLTKSSDPVSGSTVKPDSKITYTVTGTNTGATALDPVVIRDDMSKVLAHATLVGAPTATIINADGGKTAAAAPVVNGTTITWTGKLAKGERVELVYTVQVNADAASVTLKNVVTSTATPPGGGELTPPPGTTTHEVPPAPVKPTPTPTPVKPTPTPSNPGGHLPQTGTDVPVWLPVGAAVLVLIGVGTLIAARTRREH